MSDLGGTSLPLLLGLFWPPNPSHRGALRLVYVVLTGRLLPVLLLPLAMALIKRAEAVCAK